MRKYGTILIVDDEKDIGSLLTELLEENFEKVIYCDNAMEAMGVTKAVTLSAILTDLHMPGMSGEDFVRKLRSEGNLTPVMFLTGQATKETVLSAMRLGVCDIFEKPLNVEDIASGIERVLEIAKRHEAIRAGVASAKDPAALQREKKILGLLHVVNEAKKKV